MKARIRLSTPTHFIEWADTPTGRMQAKAVRKSHPQFKRRKLRRIIQAYPEQIECGTVYEFTA